MKIAILGELSKPISLEATGGMEMFCALLAIGLARRGNDVTLFATESAEQLPGVKIVPVAKKTLSQIEADYNSHHEVGLTGWQMISLSHGLLMRSLLTFQPLASTFDVLHANPFPEYISEVSELLPVPIVSTYHMPPPKSPVRLPELLMARIKNHFVAISENQKKHLGFADSRVYNGIDVDSIPFSDHGGDSLLWIGRIGKDAPKGLPVALTASSKTGKKLSVAGFITDQAYYKEFIQPLISPQTNMVGVFPNYKEKHTALGNSRAFIYPIEWEEPFGLVFIEAMAAGTPVIAFSRGAVPEIIVDGETGFIVNASEEDKRGDFFIKKTGEEGIEEAIERIYDMSDEEYRAMRKKCRERVEQHFSLDLMCENYERIYTAMINSSR